MSRSITLSMRLPALLVAALLLAGVAAGPVRGHDPVFGVEPDEVEVTLAPGESTEVDKTVHTPEILPTPDIYFLADTTFSMSAVIGNVQADATAILTAIDADAADPRYGAGDYRDFPFDAYAFNNGAAIPVADDGGAAALAAIGAWAALGGGDGAEAQLYALHRLIEHAEAGFRAGSSRIVVWFGDAPGHDPVCDAISGDTGHTVTEASVTAALVAEEVRVIAISTSTGLPGALDADPAPFSAEYAPFCAIGGSAGQATRIAAATGGVHLSGIAPGDIADAILAGLGALSTEVVPSVTCDDPNVTVTFEPASQTVTSGDDATFVETISAGLGAPQGETVECSVDFLVDGQLLGGFTQSITVHVPDVTPPTAACDEGTNPSGRMIPPAANQNPDGFYLLSATDNVDDAPDLWVIDSGSGHVFGPYPSGTTIKYTEAPGGSPSERTIGSAVGRAGAVTVHLTGTGDAILIATDASGNTSDPVWCRVPPPPR